MKRYLPDFGNHNGSISKTHWSAWPESTWVKQVSKFR